MPGVIRSRPRQSKMPRSYKSFPRVFVGAPLSEGAVIDLDKDHANHLVNVLRLKTGDSAVLFNGRDGAWLAKLTRADKKGATLEASLQAAHQPPPSDLWFGFAPLKIGRLDYLVQKATEMGAGTIQPVLTKFTQTRTRPDKLAAWVREAAEQCEVLTLPAVAPEIGLTELARIHHEMEAVKDQVGFTGTLPEFFKHLQDDPRYKFKSREEMLAAYREAQARIDPLTDRIFDVKPKATYEIRPVEPYRERSAARGSYMAASPDGSRPGVFYLNTYDPTSRARDRIESLLLHEGSPGHHFQITIQRELTGLPRIRRFGGYGAYSEGWGLYAESIGRELGVYTDPYQYFGALASELWRSIRLILDTGIHDKGWTREQAMAFGRANSSEPETVISAEVERFIAIPSQALSYKMGQLKITELRERAERELGAKFDLKAFHRAVLESGALPLSVLESKIDSWIAARRG